MKHRVELPQRLDQTRMMIVDDFGAREHRQFFVNEEAEERLFSPLGGTLKRGRSPGWRARPPDMPPGYEDGAAFPPVGWPIMPPANPCRSERAES